MKKRILDISNLDKSKVQVLKNCYDSSFEKSNYLMFDSQKFKKELGISDKDFVIVFCGRLVNEKGVWELMSAVKGIEFDYKLLIIGEIEYEREYSQKLLSESKRNKNIIMTDYIEHSELYKYYKIVNLAVVPSKWDEPAGLVVLECLKMNLPLIATRVGGIPEYVYGNNYVLCDTDNLEQNLLVEIINAKHNIDAGNTIGNKKVIENKPYSSEEYYDGFVTMISKILE